MRAKGHCFLYIGSTLTSTCHLLDLRTSRGQNNCFFFLFVCLFLREGRSPLPPQKKTEREREPEMRREGLLRKASELWTVTCNKVPPSGIPSGRGGGSLLPYAVETGLKFMT